MTRLSDAAPIVLRGMGGSCKPVCITTSHQPRHTHTLIDSAGPARYGVGFPLARLLGRSGRRLLGTATQ
jgi:hypothetical protein